MSHKTVTLPHHALRQGHCALSGAPDMSLEFEQQLTEELGGIVARNITNV